jgi:hypothetical protein
MARAKKGSARSKPRTEASADLEELLQLHRAFKAAIRKCENAYASALRCFVKKLVILL